MQTILHVYSVINHAEYNYLKVNSEKCHLLLSSKTQLDVSVVDGSITSSTKETSPGIIIDSKFSIGKHVFSRSKTTKRLHALGRIANLCFLKNKKLQ